MLTSVKKATRIVEAFAGERREWTVLDLSRQLKMPQPTVHHFLSSFRDAGWIAQDPATRRYRLSTRLWEVGCSVNFREIAESARPHLRELVNMFGETAHLGMVPFEDPRSVVYLDRVDSARPVRVVTMLGSKAPSYSSAMGKAIVAHNPEFEAVVLAGPLDMVTPKTIVNSAELKREFERTRKRGYSIARGEYIGEMIGIAAPVHDRVGPITLGIGIWASADVMTPDFIQKLGPELLATALRTSKDLGFVRANPAAVNTYLAIG